MKPIGFLSDESRGQVVFQHVWDQGGIDKTLGSRKIAWSRAQGINNYACNSHVKTKYTSINIVKLVYYQGWLSNLNFGW